MSLRMPQHLQTLIKLQTGHSSFESEVAGEQAAALGRAGRAVETAMQTLRDADANGVTGEPRLTLVKAAADALWKFLVQREALGLRDQAAVVRDYGIPKDVLARVGGR